MGTLDVDHYTLSLKPAGTAKITIWTTTDDLQRSDDDGCLDYAIDADGKHYRFHVLHREWSETWDLRFRKAFQKDPGFRVQFLQREDKSPELAYPIAPGNSSLPDLPGGEQTEVLRDDIFALKRKG